MAYKIVYSPAALNDLDEIFEYIENELFNRSGAGNTVSKILSSINKLQEFPDIGAKLRQIINVNNEYRYLITGNYLTFYRHTDDTVYIDRIIYSRRDYMRILFDDSEQES